MKVTKFIIAAILASCLIACTDTDEALKKFDPMVFETTDGTNDVITVFLKIKCTKRGADGQCNQATCERERDPNSPTGYELKSCALFTLGCDAAGHTTSGDGRNNSTCTRKAAQ